MMVEVGAKEPGHHELRGLHLPTSALMMDVQFN